MVPLLQVTPIKLIGSPKLDLLGWNHFFGLSLVPYLG